MVVRCPEISVTEAFQSCRRVELRFGGRSFWLISCGGRWWEMDWIGFWMAWDGTDRSNGVEVSSPGLAKDIFDR